MDRALRFGRRGCGFESCRAHNKTVSNNFNIPKEVSQVTETLQNADFEAYLVGGCVRDMLRGESPKDWDITTNATPEEIQKIFEDSFYENDYGTVGVVDKETEDKTLKVIEVTPYRIEGKYTDGRRPDEVHFSNNLEDDLKRRVTYGMLQNAFFNRKMHFHIFQFKYRWQTR